MIGLVEEFQGIVSSKYIGGDAYKRIVVALSDYERILNICRIDSLASDGMEMIEAALRSESRLDT